jgi:hypothetical protein
MRRVIAFVVLTAFFAGPALGFDCATPEQREQSLSTLIKGVDRLRSDIERVPPSEAEFIRREQYEAALAGLKGNDTRMRIVMNNPYYYPLHLHDNIDKVLNPLRRAEGKGTKEQALEVISAMNQYGSVTSSLDDYIRFDNNRAPKILDAKQKEARPYNAQMLGSFIGSFAHCLVEQLPAN